MREILTRVRRLGLFAHFVLAVFWCCVVLTLWPPFLFLFLDVPCPVHLFVLHLRFKLKQQLLLRHKDGLAALLKCVFIFFLEREGGQSFAKFQLHTHNPLWSLIWRERESEKETLMTCDSASLFTISHNFPWSHELKPVFMKVFIFKHRQQHARTAPIKMKRCYILLIPFFGGNRL